MWVEVLIRYPGLGGDTGGGPMACKFVRDRVTLFYLGDYFVEPFRNVFSKSVKKTLKRTFPFQPLLDLVRQFVLSLWQSSLFLNSKLNRCV